MTYVPVQPPIPKGPRYREKAAMVVYKAAADAYVTWFHETMPARIAMLGDEVRGTPGFEAWEPDFSPESLDTLGDWFVHQVKTRPHTEEERAAIAKMHPSVPVTPALTERTRSLRYDVATYLGSVIVANIPNTRWVQVTKPRNSADYGLPVVRGTGLMDVNPVAALLKTSLHIAEGKCGGERLRECFDSAGKHLGLRQYHVPTARELAALAKPLGKKPAK